MDFLFLKNYSVLLNTIVPLMKVILNSILIFITNKWTFLLLKIYKKIFF